MSAERPAAAASSPTCTDERLAGELERTAAYEKASRALATARAYASDWRIFLDWCDERGLECLPARPAAVAAFLTAEADKGVKSSTISRRLAAIGHHHREAGFDPPQEQPGSGTITQVLAGIRRSSIARKVRKRPADAQALEIMLGTLTGDDLRTQRDRAILAIGIAAALRRSEVVALHVNDIEVVPEGLRLTVGKSKTDQVAEGAVIAIPEGRQLRPKALLLAWMKAAAIRTARCSGGSRRMER